MNLWPIEFGYVHPIFRNTIPDPEKRDKTASQPTNGLPENVTQPFREGLRGLADLTRDYLPKSLRPLG